VQIFTIYFAPPLGEPTFEYIKIKMIPDRCSGKVKTKWRRLMSGRTKELLCHLLNNQADE